MSVTSALEVQDSLEDGEEASGKIKEDVHYTPADCTLSSVVPIGLGYNDRRVNLREGCI
jgi:hypothetical protein